MKNFKFRNIGVLGTALALTATLCSCSISKDNKSNSVLPDNDKSISDVTLPDSSNENENSAVTYDTLSKETSVLDDDFVLKLLTSDDKPFRLKESFLNEDGVLEYQDFGPEFYEKEVNGLKYLINAETKKVCISGYNNLGRLCCLRSLKSENGGVDSDLGYSGYVLLAIYNIDGETLFSLYDFDDFTVLLDKCDLSASTSFTNNIFTIYHLSSYDPKYNGHDDENEFTGYVFRVEKDGICYFVDVNDFRKIVLSGDFTFYNENISATGNATISYYDYDTHSDVLYCSEDLIPTYSDVLQKTLVKPTNE